MSFYAVIRIIKELENPGIFCCCCCFGLCFMIKSHHFFYLSLSLSLSIYIYISLIRKTLFNCTNQLAVSSSIERGWFSVCTREHITIVFVNNIVEKQVPLNFLWVIHAWQNLTSAIHIVYLQVDENTDVVIYASSQNSFNCFDWFITQSVRLL